MRIRILSAVMLVLLVSGLASCRQAPQADQPRAGAATESSGPEPAVTSPSSDAVHPAATRADYEKAVQRVSDCVAAKGVTLVNGGWDPVTNQHMTLGWKAPSLTADEGSAVVRECRLAHLNNIEAQYSTQHEAHMSPKLMTAVQKCLTEHGVAITGRERTSVDLVKTATQSRQTTLYDCVHKVAYQVYPNLDAVSFP